MKRTKLRYGQVGGSLGSFIGGVHRRAIAIEETAELVAACFDPRPANNQETGAFYGLDPERVYADYQTMARAESQREDRIDFVDIATPNSTHYEIAKAFLKEGINVSCEKPLCFTVEQAEELQRLAKEHHVLFAVTYTYLGYAMVKFARELIEAGEIGEVINVNAEYLQDWLIDEVEKTDSATSKLSVWRMDPSVSGGSNCVGDIGTHIEAAVTYMTGLKTKRVCAQLDNYGMELDLNANILVEFENGSHGVFSCSQVCCGHYNGLVVRIFGSKGAIEWAQEEPEFLKVTKKGEPKQVYARGTGCVTGIAERRAHIPSGHPEGLTMAFANIYRAFQDSVLRQINGETPTADDQDYPSVAYGIEGVKFIQACVKSSKEGCVWIDI